MPAAAFAVLLLATAAPQDRSSTPPSAQPQQPVPPVAAADDIVVEGYRDRMSPDLRSRVPPGVRASTSMRDYDMSERLAKCAVTGPRANPARLRAVVDGVFGSGAHHVAQDRLVRAHITCSESPQLLTFSSRPAGAAFSQNLGALSADDRISANLAAPPEGAPLGWSIYDRGAFTVLALRTFAPGLKLSRRETDDRAVQQRFDRREIPLAARRDPVDRQYFEAAVCMVRLAPTLAVRVAYNENTARFDDATQALIDRTRACVGGARKVRVDPTQFRLYIADAVYRWAVAARGVDSLIPA